MGESSLDPKARNTAISCKSNWVLLRECTLLVLPMVTFSAILLGLVIYHQWHRHHAALRGLELSAEFSSSIFYVDYSATRLILVASWSSSTVFALMGSFMTLLSFPIASDMIRNSRGPSLDLLPTPNQLALLIDLLDGKKGALWPWAMGLWKRKENRTRSVWALESSAALLIFAVVLSLSIIAADSWLHLSTKSIQMPYYADVNPAKAGAAYRFSRVLIENCRDDDKITSESNFTLPCSVYSSGPVLRALHPETIDSILLNDFESRDTIHRDDTTGLSFIGGPSQTSISLSGGELALPLRFNASTFAMNTTCSLVQNCMPKSGSQSKGSFTCGSSFSRDPPGAWFALSPWESPLDLLDSDRWQHHDTWAVYAPYPEFHIEPGGGTLIVNSKSDPVVGSSLFVLKCVSSLETIRYTWTNDKLTQLLASSAANRTLLNIQRGPFLSDHSYNEDHLKSFAARLRIDLGMEAKNYTKNYYTQHYATLLSEIGLSFLGGSIEPRPAISLQVQNETVVTQVPKTAFSLLIIFNLWYAFVGFCLFLVAGYTTAYGGRRADVRAVQELLTVIGLTTAAVTKTRSNQGTNLRIGVEKVEDEWQFKVWDQKKDIEAVNHSAIGRKPSRPPNLKASKGLPHVQVVSFGSTHSRESAEHILLTSNDTRSWHTPGVALTEDGSISPASTPEGSISGDHDQLQLISQSLIWARLSEQDSDDVQDNPASLEGDTSSLPQGPLSTPMSVDGPPIRDAEDFYVRRREQDPSVHGLR